MSYNRYEIGFEAGSAYASVEVEFADPVDGAADADLLDFKMELRVSGWEHSYYRPSERDFSVESVTVEAFGREYHYDLDDVLSFAGVSEYDFMSELERHYDDYADECRAEALYD